MCFVFSLKRIAAFLIDTVLVFVMTLPLDLLVQRALPNPQQTAFEELISSVIGVYIVAWLYFGLSDHSAVGATPGKRLLRLRVTAEGHGVVSLPRALARTVLKLLPFELSHIFWLALEGVVGRDVQNAGLIAANLLLVVYLAVLLLFRGRRSVHDLVVETQVVPAHGKKPSAKPV